MKVKWKMKQNNIEMTIKMEIGKKKEKKKGCRTPDKMGVYN